MENTKRIIEIEGVKLEVDLRDAKTIEHYKVGDNIKLLKKEYGDDYSVYPAIIVGFEPFEELPTITIVYVKKNYDEVEINFVHFNKQTKGVEICPAGDVTELWFKESDMLDKFQTSIAKLEEDIKTIKKKRDYFKAHFNQYFKPEKEVVK